MNNVTTKRLWILLFCLLPCLAIAQETQDYFKILKNAGFYNKHDTRKVPAFTYQSANEPKLVALRNKYRLDSIAGYSNEVARVLNLLHWVHNTISHDGVSMAEIKNYNADYLLTLAREKKIGLACGELATVLNDCYLAMGWKSRKVYCYPRDSLDNDPDSHVINMVYLESKKKWIWVDPTNDAYIMDTNGALLSIEEVRKKIITNRPLIVTPEANLNGGLSVTQDEYIAYMQKNLYLFYCPVKSEYDYETPAPGKTISYVYLLPLDYINQRPFHSEENNKEVYKINNPDVFWQTPDDTE